MDKNRKNSNKYHKDLGKILLNPSASGHHIYISILYVYYIYAIIFIFEIYKLHLHRIYLIHYE